MKTVNPSTRMVHQHDVQFYARPEDIVPSAAAFLVDGAQAGEGLLVLCRSEHRQGIEGRLRAAEVPADRVFWLDAEAAAAALMVEGRLVERLFLEHIGTLAAAAAAAGNGSVRAFGEVVTVLCQAGDPEAALRLEAIWHRYISEHRIALLCGYPLDTVAEADLFDCICAAHDSVHPMQDGLAGTTRPRGRQVRGAEVDDVLRIDGDPLAEDAARQARLAWQTRALAAEVALRRDAQTQILARELELQKRAARQESVLRLGAAALAAERIERLIALAAEEVGQNMGADVLSWCAGTSGPDPAAATRDCGLCVPVRTKEGLRGLLGLRGPDPVSVGQYLYLTNVAHVLAAAAGRADAYQRLEDQRAQLERVVEERTRHLVEVNQELEAFNSSVSHDLRNHVRVVTGYASLLAERHAAELHPTGQALVARLEHQSIRMAQVIDDLLALARLTRLSPAIEPTDVTAMAHQVAAQVAASHPHQVGWTVQSGLHAAADPALLRIMLENLLGNAWKFTRDTPAPAVHVGAEHGPHGTAFFVRDNGIGFPAGSAARLFQPFSRLHGDQFPGYGMGLATVVRIASRHGGRAWAEGSEGRGATIWFTLQGPTVPQGQG